MTHYAPPEDIHDTACSLSVKTCTLQRKETLGLFRLGCTENGCNVYHCILILLAIKPLCLLEIHLNNCCKSLQPISRGGIRFEVCRGCVLVCSHTGFLVVEQH